MSELERKKLENSQNLEFVKSYLEKTNLSNKITSHPRFDSILWKISSLMRKAEVKAFSETAINLLNSTIITTKDGSIVLVENKYHSDFISSIKYYFDENDMTLKRIACDRSHDGSETTTISTYDDDGIEENMLTEQKLIGGSKYYSNATRVPGRIDMIKVQSILEKNGKRETLADAYQIRTMCVAYEDILPEADEIDPLDVVHMFSFGVPPMYRDLEPKEQKIIDECDGEIFPLDDIHKEEQLMDYIEKNKFYGRSRRFEGALSRYLEIEDRIPDDEQL